MRIDLHTHTTSSDGRTPPVRLAQLARAAGLDVIAVTDHDTTDGVAEAAAEGERVGLRVVPGIEVSSTAEGVDVHVLGIGVHVNDAAFQRVLSGLKASRRGRVERICSALRTQGVALQEGDVYAQAAGSSVGRKHVAQAMVARGLVHSIEEAFGRYLSPGRPAHVPANDLTPADAARLVRGAGGFPVLAHPGFLGDDGLVERVLDSAGIRGLEVWHHYEGAETHRRYEALAQRRDLIATGGSDYHGDEPPKAVLGRFTTPADQWARLERMLRA